MVGDVCKEFIYKSLYNYFGKMRMRSVERKCRSRGNRSPTTRIENDFNLDWLPQYYQVTVNVLEARKLNWSNPRAPNSYVVVVLGKKKHRTAMRRNMEEPHYREYFVFDICMSLKDMQRSSLWLAVMEPKCCAPPKLVGETTIDLGAIWAQPHHQVYHKWAQLSVPRDPIAGCVGFLKVDISIILRGEVQIMPAMVMSNHKLEDNLLIPTGSEQQRANFQITIYEAYGIPNGSSSHIHRRNPKAPSTFVRVSFCGLVGKTGVQARTHNPKYNEQICIVEMFPNSNQTITIEVCSGDGVFNKILASTDLKLGQISHDGENGFLPTFGPSLLQMYSMSNSIGTSCEEGPYHRGSLLLALKTLVPFYQQTLRTVTVEPVSPIDLKKIWVMEDFCTYCPIYEVSMLDKKMVGNLCGVAISLGEISSDKPMDPEFDFLMEEIKSRKLHYTGSLDVDVESQPYGYVEFPYAFPVLQLITRLPDFRFRMYRHNMIQGIVCDLEEAIENIENRLQNFIYGCTSELINELIKVLDDTSGNIMKFLDINSHSSGDDSFYKFNTELDMKQQQVQTEEIQYISNKILDQVRCFQKNGANNIKSRKEVKFILAVAKNFAQSLRNVMRKTSNGWPDLVVWLLSNGSRVAYQKIAAADFIYSVIKEQCGKHCGRILTLYMKPLKCPKHMNTTATSCFCIVGKVEIQLWAGLYRQKSAFEQCLPIGYRVKVKDYDMCVKASTTMVECRAFIYKAKLCSLVEKPFIEYPFVRINILKSVKETKRLNNTCTPVWNQKLIIQKTVYTSPERLLQNPPSVLVEVFDGDPERKVELIGRVQIEPVIDDKYGYNDAPPLQMFDLYRGAEFAGKIMMSVQLLQFQGCNRHDVENKQSTVDEIKIYESELELQPEFHKFKDWCSTLKLYNGKKTGIPEKDRQLQCGFLKAGIAIYRWPPPDNTVAVTVNGVDLSKGYYNDHPSNEPKKFLVRVYVVKALISKSKDFTGKSDPYIVLSCGKKHFGDRNNYVANSTNPIFGRLFEFRSTLPEDYQLTLSLYDYDAIPPDELIGSTSIDLEDRIYTKHRARVGLASKYKLDGSHRWRDSKKPSVILQEVCSENHLAPPVFLENNSVLINNVEYIDRGKDKYSSLAENKEDLCLYLLKNWQNMPICGYHLVPEHVETRSLYNPDKHGVEQGKVQLWIDIFPLDINEELPVPSPLDIDPRKTEEYELRVIIWTAKLEMTLFNAITAKIKKRPNLVVKTWIGSLDNVQYTDVHYNVDNGTGKFNWRMIFHFDYMHSRKMLVEKEQGPFTECHEYSQPCLNCQILECNLGEVVASLTLNLNSMSCGSKTADSMHLSLVSQNAKPKDSFEDSEVKRISLFSNNSIRSWWPLENINFNAPVGIIDLEMELVTVEEGKCFPVGVGRDPPCPILCPVRRVKEDRKYSNLIKKVFCHKLMTDNALAIYIICAVIFGLILIAYLLSFLFSMDIWWSITGHHGHSKNNEGIIRTLYPIRA